MARLKVPRRVIVLTCLLLLLAGAGAAWLALRGPLAGAKTHDFGSVAVPAEGVKLHHTFVLTNRTSHEIAVRHVGTTCGCTEVTTSSEHVPPGGPLEVAVTFSLKAKAEKFANINLDLGDEDGVVTLTVSATGKKPSPDQHP